MSHSPMDEARAWDFGMVDSDVVAFPICEANDEKLLDGLTTKATGDPFEALEPIHQGVREHFACCAHLPGRGHPGGEN